MLTSTTQPTIPDNPWIPGSLIRRVPLLTADLNTLLPHSGILDWPFHDGSLAIIHNCKDIGVVRTSTADFALPGQMIEIFPPSTAEHQNAVIARANEALAIGTGYDFDVQNCQDFANWAFYGVPFSEGRTGLWGIFIFVGFAGIMGTLTPDQTSRT